MNTHLSSSPKSHAQIVLFLSLSIAIAVSTCFAIEDGVYRVCSDEPINCGGVRNLTYPFWGGVRPQFCGHKDFNLTCLPDAVPVIDIGGSPFIIQHVAEINHTMTISRFVSPEGFCNLLPELSNITFDQKLFDFGPSVKQLYIYYGCEDVSSPTKISNFTCPSGVGDRPVFYTNDSFLGSEFGGGNCENGVKVPVSQAGLDGLVNGWALNEALSLGFDVSYKANNTDCSGCEGSGGICGSGLSGSEFICLCPGPLYTTDEQTCKVPGEKSKLALKLGIGFGAGGSTFLVMVLLFYIYHRRNRRLYAPPSWVSRSMSSYPSSVRDLERTGTYNGVQIFSYEELEKATNYFDSKRELGDGGYGTVYQGKLKDGRDIAVKRLYEHNYNRVAQFMNEVEILTRLRHQNLVSLYGFTSRHCRELLLVYEYIPNGTVADHLHGEVADSQPLSWTTRMSIAVETASALVYLHASDIIHRDVKTNNILLDNNFTVKVADFGLSRLLPTDVTHVSTAPQGTPGYVDPDYHESYQLTDKSDVFSFGVVLIELISSKPAVDMSRHRHEINLSNMAINKIQNRELHELVDPSLGFESDDKVRSAVSDVAELAFRCLQSGKDMRPTMVEVLEVLKRIQTDGCDEKTRDVPKESGIAPTHSPNSVTTPWISTNSTPNTSS